MANTDIKGGFRPVRYLNGTKWNGQFNIYHHSSIDATAIGNGDPVTPAWVGDTSGRFPNVKRAAAGDLILGVAIGFGTVPTGIQGIDPAVLFDATNLTKVYGAASTDYYVAVVDDPFVVYEVQEDSDTSNIAASGLLGTITMVAANCDTSSGLSNYELDSSSATGSQETYEWRLLGLADFPGNAIGTHAKWHVVSNASVFLRASKETVVSRSESPSASPSTSPS